MIYVASSWRNEQHGEVVSALRQVGLEVYDFKEPTTCFKWEDVSDVTEHGGNMTPGDYWAALTHPIAQRGFAQDMQALADSSTVVLLLPCGNSAHLEVGWALGQGKSVAAFHPPITRDMDLMHCMISDHYAQLELLVAWCQEMEGLRQARPSHGGLLRGLMPRDLPTGGY